MKKWLWGLVLVAVLCFSWGLFLKAVEAKAEEQAKYRGLDELYQDNIEGLVAKFSANMNFLYYDYVGKDGKTAFERSKECFAPEIRDEFEKRYKNLKIRKETIPILLIKEISIIKDRPDVLSVVNGAGIKEYIPYWDFFKSLGEYTEAKEVEIVFYSPPQTEEDVYYTLNKLHLIALKDKFGSWYFIPVFDLHFPPSYY